MNFFEIALAYYTTWPLVIITCVKKLQGKRDGVNVTIA